MAAEDLTADQITLPIKRTDGDTLEERLTSNAYNNILPARYLRKDADGNLTESQEELFERVAENIALAEAVFEAEKRGVEVTVTPEQVKPEHPRRDELTTEVFGEGTTVSDDVETVLTAENVNKFAYDTVVPELPDEIGEHVESVAAEYRELMESLSFIPNSPTLMNAGDELQQLSACIAGHAPVFTRDGLKRMDEVRPGDEVLTHRGRYKEVLDHWSNGEKSTVEMRRGIERGSCFDTQLTPDHEVYTSDGRWVSADEVEDPADPVFPVDEAFPETIDLTQYTARLREQKEVVVDEGRVKLRNASDPRTPTFDQQNNQPVASVVNDDELAWLFGLYLAEGDVYGSDLRFTLGTDEAGLCERLIETLERVFDTPVSVSESSHGRWTQIRLSSSFVADLFASVLGTGGDEKRIPTWVGDADESYRQSLLDGLLDGDGTTLDTAYRLVMANPTLVYEATLLARSLGYDAVFKLDKERELSSRRTSECYISTAENPRLSSVARREAETVEVYDMSIVDDHSFVVGDFVVHNCFVDSPDDDLTDIHQTAKEAAEVFQSGGGMGYAFWRLRPYGDPVGSTGGIASGPITFMETFDQMCETIAQGGTRRGAQMGVMRVSHPDVIEFIHSKNKDVSLAHCLRLNDPDDYTYTTFAEALEEARGLIDEDGRVPKHLRNAVEGHLSNFNISVGVTDGFMEALYEGEEFTFTNPRTGKPHVATRETKEMYDRYGLGEYVEPGEEFSIPAQVIWDRIVDGAYENGEPGVIYLERVNKQHSFDVDEHPDHQILATNPCVTGDTLISTANGLVPAEELYEQGVAQDIVVDGRLSEDRVKEASSVYKTGEKDVYKLTTAEGYELRLTADHRVMTDDGWVEAGELDAGDTVHIQNRKGEFGQHGSAEEGRVLGWLVGDGHLKGGEERAVLNFYDEDAEISESLAADVNQVVREPTGTANYEIGVNEIARNDDYRGAQAVEQRIRSTRLYEMAERLGLAEEKLQIPDAVMRGSEEMARGFLQALFTADGGVQGTTEKGNSVRLTSTNVDLLREVQQLLLNFGIASKIYEERHEAGTQEMPDGKGGTAEYERQADHDLVVAKDNLVRFQEEVGFLLESKNETLAERLASYDRGPYAERFEATVESITPDGHETVYDLTEPETHSFVANGLVAHNCGEQPLEEYEACNLGHINLSTLADLDAPDWRVWSEAHADEYDSEGAAVEAFLAEAMDWEEFDHRIEWGTRFLENVVTMSDFPVPEIEEKVREMRKIGLGVMGLAQLYVQLGVRYGSDAGNEMARQLMQHINHGSKWASHELAEDRGSFEEWGKSKYADPLEYREWFEHHTGLDAEEWAEGFPIRNHNTTTIAPTGTTSMVGNTTGGCEPIYNVAYYKNVSDDVQGDEMLVEFDDYFLRTLTANDIDVDAVKREAQEQMSNNEFDGVEGLDTVPDAIGELFVVTADLTGKEHAAVQCALQAGVDSAISKTCNFPNSASKEDMDEVYRYIYDHGGKGVTVYRDGTRSKQVLTTRADNAEYAGMDEEEAAAAILENIDQAFGDIERFLDHEAVEERLGDAIDLLASGDGSVGAGEAADIEYAEKQSRPDVLRGVTQRIDTGYGKVYITINEDAETGRPFELFANTGMSGGFTASFTEALAKSISVALRSGVDPNEIADKLRGIRSPKVAWDKGEQINSIPDAFGVALRRYLDDEIDRPYPRQQNLTEVGEGDDAAAGSSDEPEPETAPETDGGGVTAEAPAAAGATGVDDGEDATQSLIDAGESPECPDCGSMSLYFSEGCKTCQACGWSEC